MKRILWHEDFRRVVILLSMSCLLGSFFCGWTAQIIEVAKCACS